MRRELQSPAGARRSGETTRIDPHEGVNAPPRRRWPLYVGLVVAVAVFALGGALVVKHFTADDTRDKYLQALTAAGLRDQFANDEAAVANARRICKGLVDGHTPEGYKRDAVGVQSYCSSYYEQFKVIPTPEEQRTAYLAELRGHDLAGKFSSDENAVAHAHKVCNDLDSGGAQQGLPQDKIAVQVYCANFLSGFKVLRTRDIEGIFTLQDSDPSEYFPSIISSGGGCEGSGGYSDIGPGTTVTVKNGSGTILAQTTLGQGVGGYTLCTFSFSVRLTEGEDTYSVEVSHRGAVNYTFSQLDTLGIGVSLGS
jgi:hypothetical protein